MLQLPFVSQPVEKIRLVGNEATGSINIRSVGAMTDPETDYYDANRVDWQRQLVKVTKEAMLHTGRKHAWRDVLNAVYSLVTTSELLIPELEQTASDFNDWYDQNTVRNNKIAAVAMMRNRVEGCGEMTIADFENDKIVPPGLRAKLIEFAINESNGWPKEQEENDKKKKEGGEAKPTAPAAPSVLEVTEAQAEN